jgi:hypothetical protein
MKKILSILLVVAMIFSLVVISRVPTASAVSGLRTADQYTWLPTYKFGEPIVGVTNNSTSVAVKLLDNTGAWVATFDSTDGAGNPFYFDTGALPLAEGTYTILESTNTNNDNTDLITGTDKKVYVQEFSLPTPSTSTTPTFGATGVLIWGNLYYASSGTAATLVTLTLMYSTDHSTWAAVPGATATTTTPNGAYVFTGVSFNQYGYYGIFAYTGAGYQPYFYWYLAPGGLTITKVIVDASTNEIPLYAGVPGTFPAQHAYVRVTDADGAPVTGLTAADIVYSSGTSFTYTVTELGGVGSGFYDIAITTVPGSAGISNILVTNPSTNAQSTFSLTWKTLNAADINPTATMNVPGGWTGLKIGQFVGFDVYYNVGSQYDIGQDPNGDPLQYTSFESPVPLYVSTGFDDTTPGYGTFAYTTSKGLIMQGGQITIDAQAMLWTTGDDALTASTKEAKKVFKVNPTITGDIVTVSPTSVTVGDTADLTVTVKTAAGVERNNALVTLSGAVGMFTYPAPSGANYKVSADGSTAYIDAGLVNVNIVGGNYVFNGLKFNLTTPTSAQYVNVMVQVYPTMTLTANLYHKIKVNPKSVTLSAGVDHLVAGLAYPMINVTGGVTGLTFTGLTADYVTFSPSVIDNGDGTYVFNLPAVPDTASITFTGTKTSVTDTKYVLKLNVVKPKIEFVSVHKDGLITDSFAEIVEFKVLNPDDGSVMFTTSVALVPQYTTWDVTGQSNLQVSAYDTTTPYTPESGTPATVTSNNFVESSTVGATWTTGNENVDYTVDMPYVGLEIEVNDVTISYDQQLLVTAPSIKFDIQGRDPMQLYVNQSNTITATALDAHGNPLKNAKVGIAGSVSGNWGPPSVTYANVLAGGITASDGKVIFTFTPTYIGNYKLMLAPSSSTTPLTYKYIPSVQAPPDTTAPVVTITAPADGSTVSTSTVTVTGSATDNVGVTSVYLNDVTSVTLKPDGTFAAVLTLNEGANTIKVTAFDAAGNKGTATVTVTYTKPVVKQTVVKVQIGSDIMTVNGKVVQLDAAPEIVNGRTFLPLRAISEALGATVDYIADTQGITVVLGTNTIGLQIGNTSAVVNGTVMTLDAPPYIKNSRTMVPLRVIAEGLGATVEWDPALRVVTITLAQ